MEINPVTKEIVWQYDASSSQNSIGYWAFLSTFMSSARRLPNGNTLICEAMHGRIFQVTPEGEIVWEYVNPHFGTHPNLRGRSLGTSFSNFVYRAQPIPYDWVPEGTPHSEDPVAPPKVSEFRVR